MAEMNVRGNELLYELAEDLDYPIKKTVPSLSVLYREKEVS